jgi:hypothetical protein
MSDRRVNDNEQDPGHDVERLLNLLDVLDIDDDPEIDPGPVPTPARFAEETGEILNALRGQPGRRHDPRPVPSAAPDNRRRSVDHVPLLVVGGVALELALFPGQLVLALLLFGLCPALLLVKWMLEGYSGPELQRACDVLDGRADSVRGLRRRLVRMAEELVDVGPTVEDQLRSALAPSEPDEIMLMIRSASVAMRDLADRWTARPELFGSSRTVGSLIRSSRASATATPVPQAGRAWSGWTWRTRWCTFAGSLPHWTSTPLAAFPQSRRAGSRSGSRPMRPTRSSRR